MLIRAPGGKSQCSKNTHASGYDHEIEIGRAIFQSRAIRMGVNSMDFTTSGKLINQDVVKTKVVLINTGAFVIKPLN